MAEALPAPAPPPPVRLGIGAKLLSLLRENPLATLLGFAGLGALGTGLGYAVGGLGLLALRAREALLGLSPGLTYPYQDRLVIGFDSLGSLLWRGFSVLTAGHSVLRASAWALLLLLLGLVLAARSARRPALLLGALAVSALLLIVGSSFYRIALAANSSPDEGPSRLFHCGRGLSANLADRVAFETCSWLVNDTPRDERLRIDLAGLLGWLLAVCLMAIVAGSRAPFASPRLSRLRWALVGVHTLVGFLLLYDLPRAYAFGTWGLRYPQVRIEDACDPTRNKQLVQATAEGSCWAFDVSAGAENKVVFLQGSECPERRGGTFLHLGSAGGQCLSNLSSSPRVVTHE